MTTRQIPEALVAYQWPPSNAELAATYGVPEEQILRFDGNVAPAPPPTARPAEVARALADIHEYDRGRYLALRTAIAARHGVALEQIVLGAGSDELIVLCARLFAPGGTVATVPTPTYAMYRFAAGMAGAQLIDDPLAADLVFCCRPNNPTGELCDVPEVPGQLVIDEAYAEYAGTDALDWIDRGAVVLRTFSKAFGLAGARVGYAICDEPRAAALSSRMAPLSVSSPSAALALAALRTPPDVSAQVAERDRLTLALSDLGLSPVPSYANFLYIPCETPERWFEALAPYGVIVRVFPGAVRISVRDREDNDELLDAIRAVTGRPTESEAATRRRRVTAETRIAVRLRPHGDGRVHVRTGAGLFDHFVEQLAFHAGFDLRLEGVGDLETGIHHTGEDAMRALGDALDDALGDRRGLARYGEARIPMDEAIAHAVVDLSGRPLSQLSIEPDPGMATHALECLAQNAKLTLHVEASGRNTHHVAEAAFKAVGRALRAALLPAGENVPSTKGSL